MELTPHEIVYVARIYHEILVGQANLSRTNHEGPNSINIEKRIAVELIQKTIPEYKEMIPTEVQRLLGVDIKKLEKRCSSYI